MGGRTVHRLATSQGYRPTGSSAGMDGTGGASSSPRCIVRYADAPSCSSAVVILAARAWPASPHRKVA